VFGAFIYIALLLLSRGILLSLNHKLKGIIFDNGHHLFQF
jgi:hypothetical protein